jgi:hypothetical protein
MAYGVIGALLLIALSFTLMSASAKNYFGVPNNEKA